MAITTIPGSWRNEYTGKSTDDKPVENVPNSSTFYEMDTTDLYMFDADNQVWVKQ